VAAGRVSVIIGVELVREAVENGPQRDCAWFPRDAHSLYERFGFGPPMLDRVMFRPRRDSPAPAG
jgi:hypothetical protein